MEVAYPNTGLAIEPAGELSRIVEEFGEAVFVLHHGTAMGHHIASFEVHPDASSADEAIGSFSTGP